MDRNQSDTAKVLLLLISAVAILILQMTKVPLANLDISCMAVLTVITVLLVVLLSRPHLHRTL